MGGIEEEEEEESQGDRPRGVCGGALTLTVCMGSWPSLAETVFATSCRSARYSLVITRSAQGRTMVTKVLLCSVTTFWLEKRTTGVLWEDNTGKPVERRSECRATHTYTLAMMPYHGTIGSTLVPRYVHVYVHMYVQSFFK